MLGEAGQAAVGGLAEVEAGGAVLGVGLELVGDVRRGRVGDVMAVQLDGAGAVGAAELGVVVDGRGFVADGVDREGHFGLTMMGEQAALAGGELSLDSSAGGGTRVEVVVPLAGERPEVGGERPDDNGRLVYESGEETDDIGQRSGESGERIGENGERP